MLSTNTNAAMTPPDSNNRQSVFPSPDDTAKILIVSTGQVRAVWYHTDEQYMYIPRIIRTVYPWYQGPWGWHGADRTQVVPMLAPWMLLSGTLCCVLLWSNADLFYPHPHIYPYTSRLLHRQPYAQCQWSNLGIVSLALGCDCLWSNPELYWVNTMTHFIDAHMHRHTWKFERENVSLMLKPYK